MSNNNLFSVRVYDKDAYYVKQNGENLVLIRPICEMFGLDVDRQIKTITEDEILGSERSVQTVQIPPDDQRRAHVCLPEKFIYGWLMGIKFTNTMSEETKAFLIEYKKDCYDVLFNHFHGNLNDADKKLKEKAKLGAEIRELHKSLMEGNEQYRQLVDKQVLMKSYGSPYTKYQNQQYKQFFEEFMSEN